MGNCPSFSDQQHRLLDGKRQDVTDACSTEIDVVDDVGQLLDQAYTHRVRVVAKSADSMPGCVSCHHPCNIDHPVTRLRIFTCATSNRDAFFGRLPDDIVCVTEGFSCIAGLPRIVSYLDVVWFRGILLIYRFWITIGSRTRI